MVSLPLNPIKLLQFTYSQGHNKVKENDLGYASHAWLSASLGKLAPKPFRLLESKDGLRILGYTNSDREKLIEYSQTFAKPQALEVCQWKKVASKKMPSQWTPGHVLGFELRACPIIRGERERDIFLAALDKNSNGDLPSRVDIYLKWLIQHMKATTIKGGDFIDHREKAHSPIVELLLNKISLSGFRKVNTLRYARRNNSVQGKIIELPDAIFTGELTICDPDQFATLVYHGIGRHRAFGFGMLLLKNNIFNNANVL